MRSVDYVLLTLFSVVYFLCCSALVGMIFRPIAVAGLTFVFELAGIVVAFIVSVALADWTVKKIRTYYRHYYYN